MQRKNTDPVKLLRPLQHINSVFKTELQLEQTMETEPGLSE